MTFLFVLPYGFTWAPYKQRKCKVVTKESVQRVLSLKIRDVSFSWLAGLMLFSIFMMTIACLSFWDVCCRSKMCIVSSTREAKFIPEEEMAMTSGEEKSVYAHFCQWLVSYVFFFFLPFLQPNKPASSHSTTYARRTWFTFRVELKNNRMTLVRE